MTNRSCSPRPLEHLQKWRSQQDVEPHAGCEATRDDWLCSYVVCQRLSFATPLPGSGLIAKRGD
jgi:hypothetical protein